MCSIGTVEASTGRMQAEWQPENGNKHPRDTEMNETRKKKPTKTKEGFVTLGIQ